MKLRQCSYHDVARREHRECKDDCQFTIRTNNGYVFYCQISPAQFLKSPQVTNQYFRCLEVLRFGDKGGLDDVSLQDAYEWLSGLLEPIIAQLTSSKPALGDDIQPTLSQYLFPTSFDCSVRSRYEKLQPYVIGRQDLSWEDSSLKVDEDVLKDLGQSVLFFYPSEVRICYGRSEDSLIQPPSRVVARGRDGQRVTFFFKRFDVSSGPERAIMQLKRLQETVVADLSQPPKTPICQFQGVVRSGNALHGMLLTWIDVRHVFSREGALRSPAQLRNRWASQIRQSVEALHQKGITWGEPKAENVLIDKNDDAWITGLAGSHHSGWAYKDKAGALDGDLRGLREILGFLA